MTQVLAGRQHDVNPCRNLESEHVFRVLKCQFGYRKVRYRGLAKNAAQLFSLLALANLYLARRTLASS